MIEEKKDERPENLIDDWDTIPWDKHIKYIGRSSKAKNGHYIVGILYVWKNKLEGTKQSGKLLFWATKKQYYELRNDYKPIHVYWKKWAYHHFHLLGKWNGTIANSKCGIFKNPWHEVEWYNGQMGDGYKGPDPDEVTEEQAIIDAVSKHIAEWRRDNPPPPPETPITDSSFLLPANATAIPTTEEPIVDEGPQRSGTLNLDSLEEVINDLENVEKLWKLELFTQKDMFKFLVYDIQGMFGLNIHKKFAYKLLKGVAMGKLSPQSFTKYKYKIKQIYTLLEEEGVKGVGIVGRKYLAANNPLIRNRYTYKGYKVAKGITGIEKNSPWNFTGKWDGGKIYTGEEAVEQLQIFHNRIMKNNARGFALSNRFDLVKAVDANGNLGVTWRKNYRFGKVGKMVDKFTTIGTSIPGIGRVMLAARFGFRMVGKVMGMSKHLRFKDDDNVKQDLLKRELRKRRVSAKYLKKQVLKGIK